MPGKYYEDLEVGTHYQHSLGRTVTEMDNVLFSMLTMNPQPLHVDEVFASKTQFGRRLVNGIFTMGLVIGLTVPDITQGTIVANIAYDKIVYPQPVYHGDTITAETDVLDKRESKSRPDCGIVRLKQTGRNQDGVVVIELERTAMFLKRGTP